MSEQTQRGEGDNNNLTLSPIYDRGHRHKWIENGNHIICFCGKKRLNLKNSDIDGLLEGIKSNGSKYTVRNDRHRYFFPSEWKLFIKKIKEDSVAYYFFLTALHTGGRAMEIINLKVKNINLDRATITFETVKQRKAKRQFFAIGKTRTFFVSEKYIKEIKRFIKLKSDEEYLFMDTSKLPKDYDRLSNKDKKKYYIKTEIAYSQMFKRKMKSSGIKDWQQFSLHNIRKTYGNWMRTYDTKTEEICYRLGHDFQTYLTYYGSAMIFNQQDRIDIKNIMGDVK